jgi:hypothetical protein
VRVLRLMLLALLAAPATASAQVQVDAPLDGARVAAVAFGKQLVTANVARARAGGKQRPDQRVVPRL